MAIETTATLKMAKQIKNIILVIIGFAFGSYTGIAFLAPSLIILIVWLMSKRVFKSSSHDIIWAFSIQLGQALSILLASLALNQILAFALEVIIVVILSLWLILKTGIVSAIVSVVYQIATVIINILLFISTPLGGPQSKGIIVSVVFRIATIFYIFRSLYCIRNAKVVNTI